MRPCLHIVSVPCALCLNPAKFESSGARRVTPAAESAVARVVGEGTVAEAETEVAAGGRRCGAVAAKVAAER